MPEFIPQSALAIVIVGLMVACRGCLNVFQSIAAREPFTRLLRRSCRDSDCFWEGSLLWVPTLVFLLSEYAPIQAAYNPSATIQADNTGNQDSLPTNRLPVIRSAAEVVEASATQVAQQLQVDLAGTLILYDPKHTDCYIQHGDKSVYVGFPSGAWPDTKDLHLGDQVRVVGKLSLSHGCVDAESLEVISDGQQPSPSTVPISQMRLGDKWGRWTVQKGLVQRATLLNSTTYLGLSQDDALFSVRIPTSMSIEDVKSLIGSEIEVSGALASERKNGEYEYFTLMTMSADQIVINKRQTIWEDPPRLKIGELEQVPLDGRLHFEAVIGHVNRFHRLLVEDGFSYSTVTTPLTRECYAGEAVEVYGTRTGRHQIRGEIVIHKGTQPLGPSTTITAAEFIASEHPMRRVRMSGDVLYWNSLGTKRRIHLLDGGHRFYAEFEADDETFANLKLGQVARINCQGTAMVRADDLDPERFRVLAPYGKTIDVELLTAEVQNARLMRFATMAILFASGVAALVAFMRYQVNSRTQQLTREAAWLQASFNAVREGVLLVNEAGTIQRSNGQLMLYFQMEKPPSDCEELLEKIAPLFQSPDSFRTWWHQATAKTDESDCREFSTNEECPQHFVVYTAPVHRNRQQRNESPGSSRIWMFDNVTQQRNIESQLRQSHKMDAIGQLAGGVAHDFNNILATILCNFELMRLDPEVTISGHMEKINLAEEAIERATKLTSSLLEYSRDTRLDSTYLDLNVLIRDMVDFVQPLLGTMIEFSVDTNPAPVIVNGDKARMQQVLLNLCLNARNAIDGAGSITIKTFTETSETHEEFAVIQVIDNGCGIASEHLEKIFDPFYTTRRHGQGAGLGLSMAYGIISQHNGTIGVESSVDHGTTITIRIPQVTNRIDQPAESAGALRPRAPVLSSIPQTGEGRRVLLADDEEALRRSLALVLSAGGYCVDQAENGLEVLEMLHGEKASQYNLVLMDMSMPKMTGLEALAQLRRTHPDLPVIMISGLITSDEFKNTAYTPDAILNKPVSSKQLLETIQQVIC